MARILVVDDEVEIRTLLRKILTRRGHEVIEAENGSISGGGNRVADGYLPAATALGADHVIEKPFDPTEVGEQIENLLPPQP